MPDLARLDDAGAALTAALARSLAAEARGGDVLLLDGPLGAGKTHFARAFVRARLGNSAEDVPSPSFTLVQTYDAPQGEAVWHVDLYRLDPPADVAELGLDDAAPDDIRLIEWPDRLAVQPAGALRVTLAPTADPDRRGITLSGDPAHWPDLPRLVQRARFLDGAGWGEAVPAALAGDASARRYLRATATDGTTAVLMDAPPGTCGPYLAMTDWLRARGFHAPEVLAADPDAGLLLLEDLGDDLLARVLDAEPSRTGQAYLALTDTLVALHRHTPPDGLLALDGRELSVQVGLFAEWYGPAAGVEGDGGAIASTIEALHDALCADPPPVLGLRDCHAENIVWRGADQPLGLLDFQDAVTVHPAYDLVSALQDPRREVPAEVEAAAIARYVAATGVEPEPFAAAYALLGAQRNLRILGIFVRLCLRDGKPRYLVFLPRTWLLLMRNLAHPALAPLARVLAPYPPPDPALVQRIAARCGTLSQPTA